MSVEPETITTRLLSDDEHHHRDAIHAHHRRRAGRRLRKLAVHFALLRYARYSR